MEQKVFPAPAVAGILEKNFVEARIHNDGDDQDEVRGWQVELIHTYATPSYVVVDPATGDLIDHHEGPDLNAERFARWLKKAYAKWEAH